VGVFADAELGGNEIIINSNILMRDENDVAEMTEISANEITPSAESNANPSVKLNIGK